MNWAFLRRTHEFRNMCDKSGGFRNVLWSFHFNLCRVAVNFLSCIFNKNFQYHKTLNRHIGECLYLNSNVTFCSSIGGLCFQASYLGPWIPLGDFHVPKPLIWPLRKIPGFAPLSPLDWGTAKGPHRRAVHQICSLKCITRNISLIKQNLKLKNVENVTFSDIQNTDYYWMRMHGNSCSSNWRTNHCAMAWAPTEGGFNAI